MDFQFQDNGYGHGQDSHFHFLIFFVNHSELGSDFMLSGIDFYNWGLL